jgi:hypothetical protein
MSPSPSTEMLTVSSVSRNVATAWSDVASCESSPTRKAPEGDRSCVRTALTLDPLTCLRKFESKWVSMTCCDKGAVLTAPRSQVNCAPT